MKIAIFASIWAQNLGDELILKNEINILEKQYWDKTEFYVFTYDKKNIFFKKDNVFYCNYFPIWIKNPINFFKNFISFINFLRIIIISDLIILWWGWIIYDNEIQENKSPLDSWLFRVRFFNFFRKKYNFFRVWINIKNESNLAKVKSIFYKANKIEVRDSYSKDLLSNLWIDSFLEKDPVFFDKWDDITSVKSLIWVVNSYSFDKNIFKDFDLEWKKVWLAIRQWYFVKKSNISSRMEEWRIREIINYLVSNWAKVILMPHSFHPYDDIANDFLFLTNFAWEKWVEIIENMEWVYDIYKNKKIDFCISMRLHSIILSHVYEIPFLWISYSKKTDEILNQLS